MSLFAFRPTFWQRLRLAAWLYFAAYVWLPWLFFKHRRRQHKRRNSRPAPPHTDLAPRTTAGNDTLATLKSGITHCVPTKVCDTHNEG